MVIVRTGTVIDDADTQMDMDFCGLVPPYLLVYPTLLCWSGIIGVWEGGMRFYMAEMYVGGGGRDKRVPPASYPCS